MADATVPTRRITQLRDGDGEAAPQAGAPPPRSAVSAAPGPLLLALSAGGGVLITHSGYWLGIGDTKW